jgi:YfiH family protein
VIFSWQPPGPYVVAFSTRRGGVSEGPYESLNLGERTGDELERVRENRRRLAAEVGAQLGRLATNRQVHSETVHRARAGLRGVRGDGLWTDEPGVPMLAFTADCLPIAVARVNGEAPALALLHAGRLGTLGGVIEAGVRALGSGRLAAAIGPGIGPCCYEVGREIAAAFAARFGPRVVQRRSVDLWASAEQALRDAGVESVQRLDLCTACNPELFFSHRRTGMPRGVQGVIGYVS